LGDTAFSIRFFSFEAIVKQSVVTYLPIFLQDYVWLDYNSEMSLALCEEEIAWVSQEG
jgi:hypothetical protein